MKKLLLTAVATAAFANVAVAENEIYLRSDIGLNLLKAADIKDEFKTKSKASASLDVGVGYNFTDSIRAELVYGHHFNPKLTVTSDDFLNAGVLRLDQRVNDGVATDAENAVYNAARAAGREAFDAAKVNGAEDDDATAAGRAAFAAAAGITNKAKVTIKIDTVMAKAYADIAEVGAAKIFFGAGIGLARVSSKIVINGETIKFKAKNNLATSVSLGFAFKVSEGINTDVQYSFSDYGVARDSDNHIRGHSIKTGIRFAL